MKYHYSELLYFFANRLPKLIYGKYFARNLIKVHWGRGLNNFGDCLQPSILKHYGLTPVYVPSMKQADVILAGSILQLVPSDYKGYILGTGGDNYKYNFKDASILGVRGELTKSNIINHKDSHNMTLGDTGLLMAKIYPEKTVPKYELGIVLHFVDKDTEIASLLRKNIPPNNTLFINVCRSPSIVINEIKSCRHIISSSLHGLIIADAFHIPNRWIINRHTMPTDFYEYKFEDYYSSLGIKERPLEIIGSETMDTLINATSMKPYDKIDELIESLDKQMKLLSCIFRK